MIFDYIILTKCPFGPMDLKILNFSIQKLHLSSRFFTQLHISFPTDSWAQDDWFLDSCHPPWSFWPARSFPGWPTGSLLEHAPEFETVPCITSRSPNFCPLYNLAQGSLTLGKSSVPERAQIQAVPSLWCSWCWAHHSLSPKPHFSPPNHHRDGRNWLSFLR